MPVRRVALLTAGGLAPCLSSAVGGLIERYTEVAPDVEIIGYLDGYAGLLAGRPLDRHGEASARRRTCCTAFGGSPIGNSRVKLTNVKDAVERGLVQEGQDPLEVAADQLTRGRRRRPAHHRRRRHQHDGRRPRGVPAGTTTTSPSSACPRRSTTTSCRSSSGSARGPPPSRARFRPQHHRRALVEPADARRPRGHGPGLRLADRGDRAAVPRVGRASSSTPAFGNDRRRWDVHGVFVPELQFDIDAEASGCARSWTRSACVNLFVSEGAGVETIVAELTARGEESQRDPFGHVKLDTINPGRLVRQAVRRAARRREDDGAEERLLRPLRRGQRRGPRAHPPLHRPRGRRRAATAAAASSARTRSAATSCARSSSTGSRAASASTRRAVVHRAARRSRPARRRARSATH